VNAAGDAFLPGFRESRETGEPVIFGATRVISWGTDRRKTVSMFTGCVIPKDAPWEERLAYSTEFNPFNIVSSGLRGMEKEGTLPPEWSPYINSWHDGKFEVYPLFNRTDGKPYWYCYGQVYREGLEVAKWYVMNGAPKGLVRPVTGPDGTVTDSGRVAVLEFTDSAMRELQKSVCDGSPSEQTGEMTYPVDPLDISAQSYVYLYRDGVSMPGVPFSARSVNLNSFDGGYAVTVLPVYVTASAEETAGLDQRHASRKVPPADSQTARMPGKPICRYRFGAIVPVQFPPDRAAERRAAFANYARWFRPFTDLFQILPNEEAMLKFATYAPETGDVCDRLILGDARRFLQQEAVQSKFRQKRFFDMNGAHLPYITIRQARFQKADPSGQDPARLPAAPQSGYPPQQGAAPPQSYAPQPGYVPQQNYVPPQSYASPTPPYQEPTAEETFAFDFESPEVTGPQGQGTVDPDENRRKALEELTAARQRGMAQEASLPAIPPANPATTDTGVEEEDCPFDFSGEGSNLSPGYTDFGADAL
jgi:hypothetical protein